MMKCLLPTILFLVGTNAFGQLNRNLRKIESATPDSIPVAATIYDYIPPQFPGGLGEMMKFIHRKLKYPRDAKKQKISGKVVVQFGIDTLGNVKPGTIGVVESLYPSCDREVMRVIAQTRWIPARNEETNRPVESTLTLPVWFRLKRD